MLDSTLIKVTYFTPPLLIIANQMYNKEIEYFKFFVDNNINNCDVILQKYLFGFRKCIYLGLHTILEWPVHQAPFYVWKSKMV